MLSTSRRQPADSLFTTSGECVCSSRLLLSLLCLDYCNSLNSCTSAAHLECRCCWSLTYPRYPALHRSLTLSLESDTDPNKTLVLAYSAVNDSGSLYIQDTVKLHTPAFPLCSASANQTVNKQNPDCLLSWLHNGAMSSSLTSGQQKLICLFSDCTLTEANSSEYLMKLMYSDESCNFWVLSKLLNALIVSPFLSLNKQDETIVFCYCV